MIDLRVTFSEIVFVTTLLSVIFIDHYCSSQICLTARVSSVSGSCFALGWLVFHPPSDLDKRLGEVFNMTMYSNLLFTTVSQIAICYLFHYFI